MFDLFSVTLSSMLVIFLYLLIGFILNKAKLVPENTGTVLSKLENYVFVPALVINTFSTQCSMESFKKYYTIIFYSIIALVSAFILSMLLAKHFSKNDSYKRSIYRYALVFANFGFLGNAIVPMILGAEDPEILYKYMLFTLPLQILAYTWGIAILIPGGQNSKTTLSRLNNPIFYSIIIGIVLGLTGTEKYIPGFIMNTLSALSSCMAPVAMVLTGFVAGGYSIKTLLSDRKVYIATFLRLIILPTVILSVLYLFGASSFILTLALFAYATPLGINTVVFPSAYGGETKTGASMVMISHLLCIITIPLMYTLFATIIG